MSKGSNSTRSGGPNVRRQSDTAPFGRILTADEQGDYLPRRDHDLIYQRLQSRPVHVVDNNGRSWTIEKESADAYRMTRDDQKDLQIKRPGTDRLIQNPKNMGIPPLSLAGVKTETEYRENALKGRLRDAIDNLFIKSYR